MDFLVPTVNSYHPQLSFLWSAKNWVLVPAEIKNIKSLEGFKTNIRQWKPSISNCKPYRPRLSRWLCWFVIEIMLVKIPLELHIPSVFWLRNSSKNLISLLETFPPYFAIAKKRREQISRCFKSSEYEATVSKTTFQILVFRYYYTSLSYYMLYILNIKIKDLTICTINSLK